MVDLGKVVVFRSQPEDGRVGVPCCRCLARAGQRGCRFERRKQRPAEERYLLPGNHRSRALAQRRKRRRGSRRRRGILLRQQPDQLRPMRWNRRGARHGGPAPVQRD